ncbi:unnamed protein product [Didymodactylos carnosus]|uniref:Uncharacterized protein n=1 Tax=Didymodactylos carnosus TaxID=1234261 RepID=A0A815HT29_9BILA|nr:unnamed protein product [Didymodactylos carnosus]CAF1355949.1 unnamed protein product [Didymodactylos carnosus]CAF4015232.1 unnamed protein product [Didymodactylos carnosus]CAF4229644.1 unnamed protein product [Didymodactylos carnosus]
MAYFYNLLHKNKPAPYYVPGEIPSWIDQRSSEEKSKDEHESIAPEAAYHALQAYEAELDKGQKQISYEEIKEMLAQLLPVAVEQFVYNRRLDQLNKDKLRELAIP